MTTKLLWGTLVLLVLGFLLLTALTLPSHPTETDTALSREIEAKLSRIISILESMEAHLGRNVEQPFVARESSAVKTSFEKNSSPRTSSNEYQLEEITTSIKALQSTIALKNFADENSLRQAKDRKYWTDWAELERFLGDFQRNGISAKQALFFLSPPEILARFGPPSKITAIENGNISWKYERVSESLPTSLSIRFVNGLVGKIFFWDVENEQ